MPPRGSYLMGECIIEDVEADMNKVQAKRADNKVNILGVEVVITSMAQVLDKIDQIYRSSLTNPFLIVTVSPEFVMLAQDDSQFKRILNWADLAVADGVGLKLAGIKEVIPGRKLVSALISKNYRIFYLGGRGGVAQMMAAKFGGEANPGHKDIRSQILDARENARIINNINRYKPDILLVAYGAPWQEKWLWKSRKRIKAKVMMGVGGAFDYLVGESKIPPDWINWIGLEWLWRLVHEPWRWRRQLRLLQFVWLVGREKLRFTSR